MFKIGDKVKLIEKFSLYRDIWPLGSVYTVTDIITPVNYHLKKILYPNCGHIEEYCVVVKNPLLPIVYTFGFLKFTSVIKVQEDPKTEEDYYTWLANRNRQ